MMTTAAPVSVNLLGSFALRIAGNPIQKWRAGKARSLFQYLTVHRERVVLRDKLHEVLWPNSDSSPGSSSLKVAMHAVRQVLRAGADGSAEHGVRIVHEDFGYALYADDIWVDVDQFEALIEAGRAADKAGDVAAALRSYRAAMDLYQGDFLAGEDADWIIEQREWCRSLALRALDRLKIEAFRAGDFDELVHWCRRVIDIDPYCESAYRTLMNVHGRYGEVGTVRRWHDMCVRRLAQDLGVAPAEETERVFALASHAGSRSNRPVAERAAASGTATVTRLAAARHDRKLARMPVRTAS